MALKLKIEHTADGSTTLYRDDIDEHYHSVKGALTESEHVYIDCGWRKAAERFSTVYVFEVGFGTGLNAALTARIAEELRTPTIYHSVELFPLQADVYRHLGYAPLVQYFDAVCDAPWGQEVAINPQFTLIKTIDDFLTMEIPDGINTVYFDAFAPEKQPDMWSEACFRKLADAMPAGGVLTTYCAKGAIRRLLQQVGFTVERLPGPANGKREILRATRQ